jgi:hypothetical protein
MNRKKKRQIEAGAIGGILWAFRPRRKGSNSKHIEV